ncbi:MAG: glycine cleavage system protein H [Bdellovibrionaceae bacterium]|nr:glycine cleavage system protein H [Pseudobdellovibrionaceae bacterium]
MGYLWFQREDNVYTIGINEDAVDEIEKITALDLPAEGESVEAEVVCGSIETDDGQMDVYVPVTGVVTEINSAVMEDPSLIQEDPYDGWLFKIESEEDYEEPDEEDEDDEDDEDEDDEEEEDEDYEDDED